LESIYGKQGEALPEILGAFRTRIEEISARVKERTGSAPYEHLICRVKSDESMREKCRRKGLPETPHKNTIAETIRVSAPPRMDGILKALRNSGGDAIAVEDSEILKAAKTLNRRGIYAELTAAAGLAGARSFFAGHMPDNYRVVVPLTGSGLKG